MRLFHLTTERDRDRLERDGFPRRATTAGRGDRHLMLGHQPAPPEQTAMAYEHGLLVAVDVPDAVAQPFLRRDDPDADLFDVPADVLNVYAPFTYIAV